ncbi:hypothetical protein [Streptomyces sp. NPDC017673]|uniref:hypothetical protein n=1 Tax=unclassified Streptomyces TaxID=2593676 RepID=UPI0037BCD9CA
MYGHDPLLIALLLILVGAGIGIIQHRWPTIGASIDLATKVLIALIGMLVFVSGGTSGKGAPTKPTPQPSASTAAGSPALANPTVAPAARPRSE